MEIRVALFCFILIQVKADDQKFYKTELQPGSDFVDQRGEKTESHGFVEPLDFASFTQQFFQGGAQNFASQPFTAGAAFDFFEGESRENKQFQPPAAFNFPNSPFAENKQNNSGFVTPVNFVSAFDGQASASSAIYRPEFYTPPLRSTLPQQQPTAEATEAEEAEGEIESVTPPSRRIPHRTPKRDFHQGKSNYPSPRHGHKSEHAPTSVVYADSADVEVFYPPGKAILPQINGRPKPYDGYRYAPEIESKVHERRSAQHKPSVRPAQRSLGDRRAQQFSQSELPAATHVHKQEVRQEHRNLPEEQEEVEEEEEEEPKQKKSGYKYQYDSSIEIPDLVIKRYPYEKEADNDEEFTHDYEQYKSSLPGNLEKHFGTPDFQVEKFTVASTENLEKDKNCEKIENRNKREAEKVTKTCYICRNPQTGGSYEQCAYEEEPTNKKFYYGGATSSASQQETKPTTYRYKRSLDFFQPSGYEYFVYNDEPNLKRQARAETFFHQAPLLPTKEPKRKTKKFTAPPKKKAPKRKPRQYSSVKENPPQSYNGPKYTYEGPSQPYEGPEHPYEGPSSPYEGPPSTYEGPDHDDYYDRTDDRIPYASNQPLLSSFFDDNKENKKRPRRGPKADVEEFKPSEGYQSDYRFGPEFFNDDDIEEQPEPAKRNTFQKQQNSEPSEENEEFFSGNVKIFKNGDVCTKMKKDNMLCMVCNNEKTGAKYEQCQYSSKPNKQGYTYGSQKSFSSNKRDNERPQRHIRSDQVPEISNKVEKKYMITKVESKKTFNEGSDEPLIVDESRKSNVRKQREADDEEAHAEDVEEAEEEEEDDSGKKRSETSERIEARDGIEGLDEFLEEQKQSNYPGDHESYEDYLKRVFPEFSRYEKLTPDNFDPFSELEEFRENGSADKSENVNYEESGSEQKPTRLIDQPSSLPPQFFADDEESKKDLAKAFASFQNRDWSKCKQIIKDKLICYQCLNAEGIKNEECMYVEGSEPVTSHTAYHTKKDYDPAASSIEAHKAKEARLNTTEAPLVNEGSEEQRPFPRAGQSLKTLEEVKGDFEGVERSKKQAKVKVEEKDHPIKRKKYPIKKYQRQEKPTDATWESTKLPKIDESVVQVYLNNTESTTEAQ